MLAGVLFGLAAREPFGSARGASQTVPAPRRWPGAFYPVPAPARQPEILAGGASWQTLDWDLRQVGIEKHRLRIWLACSGIRFACRGRICWRSTLADAHAPASFPYPSSLTGYRSAADCLEIGAVQRYRRQECWADAACLYPAQILSSQPAHPRPRLGFDRLKDGQRWVDSSRARRNCRGRWPAPRLARRVPGPARSPISLAMASACRSSRWRAASPPGSCRQCPGCPAGPFPPPVADSPGDGQRLLVIADGAPRVAQRGVGQTQVAQVGLLPRPGPPALLGLPAPRYAFAHPPARPPAPARNSRWRPRRPA